MAVSHVTTLRRGLGEDHRPGRDRWGGGKGKGHRVKRSLNNSYNLAHLRFAG